MTQKVIQMVARPGIQRDGTQFDSDRYVDGRWVRFQRGRPRKMGGYRGIFLNGTSISRGMAMASTGGLNYVVSGYNNGLEQWQTDNDDGVGSGPLQYTLQNFTPSNDNLWQFDIGFDATTGDNNNIAAHPGQNLNAIDSTVNTPVLTGVFPQTSAPILSKVGVFDQSGTITSGSDVFVSDTPNPRIGSGQTITAPGIPAGTTVLSVVGVNVTMSANAASSGTVTAIFDNNIAVSGGCVMIHPYLFVYGNNGLIQNCGANDFQNWVAQDANINNVATGKIVKGLPVRGGTTSPSGLFWALDALIRVSYTPQSVGGQNFFWTYDLISSQTSIMSSSCVIEYDGIFYWCGVDRFLMYNGVVQEIPNDANQNFFFDNLNYSQRQKVWATKIPRWGEIWWFYPKGSSEECNDAIIYNIREKCWYDSGTALGARRSAGVFSEVFRKPIWSGVETNSEGKHTIWQHESGMDKVYLTNVDAIQSYFETPTIGSLAGLVGSAQQPGNNVYTRLERIEPDFIQSGQMTVTVTGKGYAEDSDDPSDPVPFEPNTLKVDVREQRREMRLRFESNVFNGNYETGRVMLSVTTGDVRSTGNP